MLKDFNLKAGRQENVTDFCHIQLVHKQHDWAADNSNTWQLNQFQFFFFA